MTVIDGEYRRIPRRKKRKSSLGSGATGTWDNGTGTGGGSGSGGIFQDTSIGSAAYDILNPNQYDPTSPDAPTQTQIDAVMQQNARLDSIGQFIANVKNVFQTSGTLIIGALIVFFVLTRN